MFNSNTKNIMFSGSIEISVYRAIYPTSIWLKPFMVLGSINELCLLLPLVVGKTVLFQVQTTFNNWLLLITEYSN